MNSLDLPLYSPAPEWTGRDDGPGPEHARWHSVVTPATADTCDAVVLLGYATDEGVLRNDGRQGAAAGPEALRSALGGLAVHDERDRHDAGTVATVGDNLEESQEEVSRRVAELIEHDNLVILLGGGHETAFASHRGLYRGLGERAASIVNLDAHFDLREAERPTSGTPFKQIADLVGDGFDYSVFGISTANNTRVLFETAQDLDVRVVTDVELASLTPEEAGAAAVEACIDADAVHLSIDLDVLPASVAPGVSAPAGLGVALERIHAMAVAVARTGKLRLVDVVELNPSYDADSRTAKTAARLINDIVAALPR